MNTLTSLAILSYLNLSCSILCNRKKLDLILSRNLIQYFNTSRFNSIKFISYRFDSIYFLLFSFSFSFSFSFCKSCKKVLQICVWWPRLWPSRKLKLKEKFRKKDRSGIFFLFAYVILFIAFFTYSIDFVYCTQINIHTHRSPYTRTHTYFINKLVGYRFLYNQNNLFFFLDKSGPWESPNQIFWWSLRCCKKIC